MLYEHSHDLSGKWLQMTPSRFGSGLFVRTSHTGHMIPDDEIPALISALQNYMSRKARELSKAATK